MDKQQRRVIDLCQKLTPLFREVWPKAKHHPSASDCYRLATSLCIVKVDFEKRARQPRPTPPAALKHARALVRHLPILRRDWEAFAGRCRLEAEEREFYLDRNGYETSMLGLCAIERLAAAADDLLKLGAPPKPPARKPAAFIASAVRDTWRRIPTAKVPQSVGPNDPLCRFVAAALSLIDRHLSPSTISDELRNRRQRQTAGSASKS